MNDPVGSVGIVALEQPTTPTGAEARTSSEASARWTEDVRLAMAWNGGVSLAVWMGGVAVELDAARRASPAMNPGQATQPPPVTSPSARTSPDLYKAICLAFDRRLVIDILAGASAGGLNGSLLAGAIVYDSPLTVDFLRSKWIEIGDFGSLLQPLGTKEPGSIMQGERFFEQVLIAFKNLLGETPPAAIGEVPVLLDVQATDVQGEERRFFDTWDQPFYAREYRSPLKFREWDDYRPGTLAAAARASASFPGAFEPQRLDGEAARLAGFQGEIRYAIDGGLLENAPIKPALELLPRRRTNGPTTRFVCYVNAAPTAHQDVDPNPERPTLGKVLGYTVNLPREARVVDQLLELEEATRRAGATADLGLRLLSLDGPALIGTANALLPAYQRRRSLLSLEELLGGTTDGTAPRTARRILASLGADIGQRAAGPALLPWIPLTLDAPATSAEWRWGVRVAQRVMQLQIDLLTTALSYTSDPGDADSILEARLDIERRLVFLDGAYSSFVAPGRQAAGLARLLDDDSAAVRQGALGDLETVVLGENEKTWTALAEASQAFADAYEALDAAILEKTTLPSKSDLLSGEPVWHAFLQRALAVEVIRRTFSDDFDIESAQGLNIAQLTPMLPPPLLAPSSRGAGVVGLAPTTSRDKLAGVRVAHFAGFYRSSWRENDFMWGRIDGATALCRLLVDALRAQHLHTLYAGTDQEPAKQLARALVPSSENPAPGDADRVWLLRELVPPASPSTRDQLEDDVANAIKADLSGTSSAAGRLTLDLCARALQYEILREEIPYLLVQLDHDRLLGAHYTELGWSKETTSIRAVGDGVWELTADTIRPIIEDLRKASGERSLPARLGCDDPDEATSNLGLRTLSDTFLVALSALSGVVPLTRWLQPVRVPILAVRGASALRALDRLAVVLGFAGACWYAVARYLRVPDLTTGEIPLSMLWSATFLALVVAAAAIVGVVFVPFVRALRSRNKWRNVGEGIAAAALLAGGGLVAAVWVWWHGHRYAEALTAYHSTYAPPSKLLWIVAAAGGFQVVSSINVFLQAANPLLRLTRSLIDPLALTLGAIGGVLAGYAASQVLVPSISGWNMRTMLSLAALAAPIAAAFYFSLPFLAWRGLVGACKRLARVYKAAYRVWAVVRGVDRATRRVARLAKPLVGPARSVSAKARSVGRGFRRVLGRSEEPGTGDSLPQ